MIRRARVPKRDGGEHGQYIYAYCNIRTKQVVYSLSQTLNNNAALKQLPDLGANNSPPSLRKDLWRPLYTLSLPRQTNLEHTKAQGLHAFKKLREYRNLHELSWKPPPALSQPYSDRQIAQLKSDLEDRGGSKKESVYDVIARRKKSLRVKLVQDQKANPVADLAAVLLEQEVMGQRLAEERQAEAVKAREGEVRRMLDLASSAEAGGLAQLEQDISAMEQRLEKKDRGEGEEGMSKRALHNEVHKLRARLRAMVFASNAVRAVRSGQSIPQPPNPQQLRRGVEQEVETGKLARKLRSLATEAENGGFSSLDIKISQTKSALESTLQQSNSGDQSEDAVPELRNRLLGLRFQRRRMELAHQASTAEDYSGDMKREAQGIYERSLRYKVELRRQAVAEAREQGASEDVLEGLEKAVEEEERLLSKPTAEDGSQDETIADAAEREAEGRGEEMLTADGQHITTPVVDAKTAAVASETPTSPPASDEEIDWAALLPSFPARNPEKIPKRGKLRAEYKKASAPIFGLDGVVVRWENPLDAEFAAQWPGGVRHEPMGLSRYTAPKGNAEPEFHIGAWKAEKGRSKRWRDEAVREGEEGGDGEASWMKAEFESEEAGYRKQFVDGMKSRILQQVREKDAGRRRQVLRNPDGVGAVRVEV